MLFKRSGMNRYAKIGSYSGGITNSKFKKRVEIDFIYLLPSRYQDELKYVIKKAVSRSSSSSLLMYDLWRKPQKT